jgi:glucose-1-phosphate cytidylyltransferase
MTGGRVRRLREWVGDSTFMLTYGDGLGSVDLRALLAFHRAHGKLVTVTAVRPPSRFGGMQVEEEAVTRFVEKPQTGEGWINGGFFVIEPAAIDYVLGDDMPWELEPMERLAADGQLMAFRHEGFWQPMDTIRDKRSLEAMWAAGNAPWKIW